MSLQIGYTQSYTTNKERIWLNSESHSNLIIINSTLPSTNIAFDRNSTFTFGLSNASFCMNRENRRIGTFGTMSSTIHSPLFITSNLTIDRDFQVRQTFFGSNVVASNITLHTTIPVNANTFNPFLTVKKGTGQDVITSGVNNSGVTYISLQGNLGIGTSFPQHALHVASNAVFGQSITASNAVVTPYLRYGSNTIDLTSNTNFIRMTSCNTHIIGNTLIQGDLNVLGTVNYSATSADEFVATKFIQTKAIILSNMNPVQDTVEITHNGFGTTHSVICAKVIQKHPLDPEYTGPYDAFVLNNRGRVGLGTTDPLSVFHLINTPGLEASNSIMVTGLNSDAFVLNNLGNLGIGTAVPRNRLHVYASNEIELQEPMINITNFTCNMPFLAAYSNDVRVACLNKQGRLTLGDISHDHTWDLNVQCNIRSPLIQTEYIQGSPERDQVIDFMGSKTCNVKYWHGEDIVTTGFTSTSNLRSLYFFTSNYSIPGLDVLNTNGYFGVSLPETLITSSNVFFASQRPQTSSLPWLEGRVRIEAVLPPSGIVEETVALHVYSTGRPVSKITGDVPLIRLERPTNTGPVNGSILIDSTKNNSLVLKHSTNTITAPLAVGATGVSFINGGVSIDNGGRLGVSLEPGTAEASFHVKNSVRLSSTTGTGGLAMTPDGAIGIGITNPSTDFHVDALARFTKTTEVRNANLTVSGTGNMMIGYPLGAAYDSNYRLQVNGGLNVTSGDLFQNGIRFQSTQWTTVNRNVCMIGNSNVGIGTTDTRGYGFFVQPRAYFNSNVIFQGPVTTQGSVSSISDRVLKDNLIPIDYPLERLSLLQGYSYDRVDTGAKELGLIAQDVQKVFPELVRQIDEDNPLLSVAYGNMAAVFVEAINKLTKRISVLESEVASLREFIKE